MRYSGLLSLILWNSNFTTLVYGQLPVVFIPGTGGSSLVFKESGDPYWLNKSLLTRKFLLLGQLGPHSPKLVPSHLVSRIGKAELDEFKLCLFEKTGSTQGSLTDRLISRIPDGIPVYEPFLKWGHDRLGKSGFYSAPYDWRLRPENNMRSIDEVVEQARSQCKVDKVILVCHSLGGLIGREYVATVGMHKVSSLISVGTPWLGTPQAARALVRGYDFGIGVDLTSIGRVNLVKDLATIDVPVQDVAQGSVYRNSPSRVSLIAPRDTRTLARSFPSLFLMCPTEQLSQSVAPLLATPRIDQISVFAEVDEEQSRHIIRQTNPGEFDWAQSWREARLNGRDGGVEHHLVGLVSSASAPDSASQVLRFSLHNQPSSAKLSNASTRKIDALDDRLLRVKIPGLVSNGRRAIRKLKHAPLAARREAIHALSEVVETELFLDEFVPVTFNREWGDGTVPLYSATAGATHSLRQPVSTENATAHLGDLSRISVIQLTGDETHMSALNNSRIRELIIQASQDDTRGGAAVVYSRSPRLDAARGRVDR